ncbi:sulfite exporter TauE/SafE family protein [Candidatus Nitrosopelagicus sp.]|nr:sulfite exporter TauE/SafE family protein [Candidatus Nitrosopelagicus sp.]
MYENLWLIPLGFVAGVLGSIVGLGGGIIAVPVMTFAGFPPTLAVSNSLFAVFSNSVASTVSYARQKRVEFGIGIKLGLMCIPGTILGAFVSDVMTPVAFQILFAFVLIASAVYIFVKRAVDGKSYNRTTMMMVISAGASFFAGIISSLFGIGGGIIFVPLMVIGIGIPMRKAAPTAQLVLMFASLSGLLVHSALGHPDYLQASFLAIGAFAGGLLGARLSLEIKERKLKILVTLVLLAAAVKLIIDSMGDLF